ncbi:MAG: hypothetical protein LBC99_07300 [Spirochaetota bacterium]|jgi:hypothetical protein|nr:hypothetical protein [Spirochaetota bacterium]
MKYLRALSLTMYRNMRLLFPAVCILALPWTLQTSEHPFQPGSARAAGMGNTWIACTAPEDAPFYNPSFLATEEKRFTLFRLLSAASGDGLDLIFGSEGSDIQKWGKNDPTALPLPEEFLNRMSAFDAFYGLSAPLFLAYKGEGFGLGLYSSSRGEFISQGTTLPTVDLQHDFDVGGIAGLAFNIKLDSENDHNLKFGANIKYLIRVRHEASNIPLSEAAGLANPFKFSTDFQIGQAIGSDLAITWRSPAFSAGLVWYDWFGTALSWTAYSSDFGEREIVIPDTRINPSLGIGVAYTPVSFFGIPPQIISEVQVALDIRGIFEEQDSFFKMIHAGFESVLFHFITLRLGLNAGYPTGGLGISLLKVFYFDYALVVEERGRFPGQEPLTLHTLSFTIMF